MALVRRFAGRPSGTALSAGGSCDAGLEPSRHEDPPGPSIPLPARSPRAYLSYGAS
jgi:hypothetical protein